MFILALVGLDVCDGGHWLGVMKKVRGSVSVKQDPKMDTTVESQVSKSARPGAPPVFYLSTFKDNSRYTRAGDVGHPPYWVRLLARDPHLEKREMWGTPSRFLIRVGDVGHPP
jgi:GH25 family lysozyme M1 (1,4-beta-N-acetylmuramidase)